MDQKFIDNGGIFTGAALTFVGMMLLPVALGMLFSYPDKIWLLGIVLLGSSLILIVSGVRAMRASSRKLKNLTKEISAIRNSGAPDTNLSVGSPLVLADWSFSTEEWQKFTKWQVQEKKSNHIVTSFILAILSIVFLRFGQETSWGVSLAISGAFALMYGFLSYQLSVSSVGQSRTKNNKVYITPNAVVFNDKLNPIVDDNRWIGDLKIIEEAEPKVLAITSYWKTRKGNSNEEIFVPIPKGKLGEAVMLMDRLRRLHANKP